MEFSGSSASLGPSEADPIHLLLLSPPPRLAEAPRYVRSSRISDRTLSPALAGELLTRRPPGKSFILALMGVYSDSHWLKKADPAHLFPTSHSEMSQQYLELGHSETIYTMEISRCCKGLPWEWEE